MKSIKINQGKKLVVVWICVVVYVISILAIFITEWNDYFDGQDTAIELMKTTIPKFQNSDSKDKSVLLDEMWGYFYYANIGRDTIYGYYSAEAGKRVAEQDKLIREEERNFNKTMQSLGYYSGASKYYFSYNSDTDSITDLIFNGRNWERNWRLLYIGVAAFLVALIVTIYYKTDRSELILDGDSLTAIKHNGRSIQFLLKDVTNVESKGKHGLTVKGNNIKYSILGINNANELKAAILKGMTDLTNQEAEKKGETSADELLKYKGLLDKGIITQEEFDAKKKQLLGL